ncbi:type VI secretion protein [Pseudomonas syringae]|uniref:Type VI secretion protein n=1 Tax=Pseudomonas syringae TaxID=317 RepID=A0A1C7Z9N1_PSESX|nr:Hcp family type VI secretion system effector [Pseudomonas syringae]OCR26543.1 type VI secretion protein [Pseudomonas syringae]
MPTPAYMTIEGTQQGLLTKGALSEASVGNTWQQGHEDQILVQQISHAITVPGGVQTGQRMHKPVIITKTLDKSSPLINTALSNGEPLKTCRIEFFRYSGRGGQELFYTIELKNALIIGVDLLLPHCQDLSTAHFTQLERVHFAYETITWRHEIAGTSGYDEWSGDSQL